MIAAVRHALRPRVPREWWEWGAPILLVAALLGIGQVALSHCRSNYSPLRLQQLAVEPGVVEQGKPAVLLNGLCNDSGHPVPATFYLGLEDATGDPLLTTRTVDLVGTTAQRVGRTIAPGCSPSRIEAVVPTSIPPGTWRLTLRLVAMGPQGQMQVITRQSPPFEVKGPQ